MLPSCWLTLWTSDIASSSLHPFDFARNLFLSCVITPLRVQYPIYTTETEGRRPEGVVVLIGYCTSGGVITNLFPVYSNSRELHEVDGAKWTLLLASYSAPCSLHTQLKLPGKLANDV